MKTARKPTDQHEAAESVRVLGRGLGAKRGVRLTLRALREAVASTQTEVADQSGIDQGDVSRLERRTDLDEFQVSTLRRYLEALGAKLDLVAVFGDKKISLAGAAPETAAQQGAAPVTARPSKKATAKSRNGSQKGSRGRRR